MSSYALTYPQLMNQARSCDFTPADLRRLRLGHEFAQRFADGMYRAQGVPLLNHLVRTGSILLAERQPVPVILCGMLHAAYMLHYFDGSARQRPRRRHRYEIRRAFGDEVDALISEYTDMPWYQPEQIHEHLQGLDAYSERLRNALIVRLANDLEDSLDRALAYCGATRARRQSEACVKASIALAEALALHRIAEGLQACSEEQRAGPLPESVVVERASGYELPTRRYWQASRPERAVVNIMRGVRQLGRRT